MIVYKLSGSGTAGTTTNNAANLQFARDGKIVAMMIRFKYAA